MLKRLKAPGADVWDLNDIYEKQINSVLEFGTPIYMADITNEENIDIERVQRIAAHVILGKQCTNYNDAFNSLYL